MFTTKDVWKWFDFVPSFQEKTSLGVYLDSALFKLQVFTEIERFPSDTPCQTFSKWQSCKWYELTIFVVSWSPVITDRDRRRWICWEGDWIGILVWLEKLDVEFRIVEDGTCHMSEIFQEQTLTQRIILHSLMGGPKHPKPTTFAPSTLLPPAFWESLCTDDSISVLHVIPMYQAFKAEIQVHDYLRFVAFGWYELSWMDRLPEIEEPRLKGPKEPWGAMKHECL